MQDLPDSFPSFPVFAPGEVWLAGAGPGDPRLLTLLALHALRNADDVVHDALVDPRILELASKRATITNAGKRGGKPSPHQTDINEVLIARARDGRRVLRLKGGDPFVFGRGGEEALALAEAGIRYRIVPGLTAGLAGAAHAGVPATTRLSNHAVILMTGHRAFDTETMREFEIMAATGQPIMLYMAMSRLAEIAEAFIRGGLAPDTPVAIVEHATLESERVIDSRLDTVAADAIAHGFGPPAIVVVGSIAGLRPRIAAGMATA
ncbi:uroporphyrinogen-III C-methyltransferase [Hyphomicrobium sp. LHD-15]|uniref:uroporphyrinogen-III C-methyltransferase n=1 Tax=Hyphomicrobium sp. LHD-15 TaxID=3072142 RepID=UPI00280D5EC6|nr:uroporphyrinogen-III C-methyltransferase [Hyphomicrobium sp. LHD-15]MDQ8699178.1 uroporphyrinogen-III C-methyltransferase [Hyphomicrobium sp. LHD-15]